MSNYKIGLITYNKPHKKSLDLFFKLQENNHTDITLLILPWKNFKKRANYFSHRPKLSKKSESLIDLKKKYNLKTRKLRSLKDYNNLDYVLIGGAYILPPKLIKKNFIINCHPGLIPFSRGLDAFKWSIKSKEILGNTLHYVDENIDMGKIIYQNITPILNSDTLEDAAKRHYDSEVSMLSNFSNYVHQENYFNLPLKKPRYRMEVTKEEKLYKNFNSYKKNYGSLLKKFNNKFKLIKPYISQNNSIKNVKFGKNCRIVQPVNIYDCVLGNEVFVGPFVEITKGVKVGDHTRISSHSFLCELVTIGKKCFIAHGVMFINDTFSTGKLGGNVKNWKETNVGDNVLIGSNSTIMPVRIASGCVIGAGSVVTKNCLIKGIYAGNPAKLIRKI
tara:strand:+ start:8493 stop:9659 length:1167 start_codon:yes stop_codon:yes gene_type:complete